MLVLCCLYLVFLNVYTSSSTYTSDGNYVSTDTDVFGDTTSYQYNNDGTVHSVTDAKNNTTTYSYYNNTSDLKAVTSGNSTNTYTYENDRIKTITTANGTVYTFNYDAFGRNTSIDLNRVNSTASPRRLVTYQYNSEDYQEGFTFGSGNNVAKVTYGNGAFYNMYYGTTGLLDSKGSAWYGYDKNNNLIIKSPGSFDLGTMYYYRDLSGRVVNKTMNAEFDGSIMYSLDYKYLNQKNLLDKYRFTSGTTSFLTSFIYGDLNKGEIPDTVYGLKLNNTLRLGYTYDNFARQNSRTLYTNNANITKTYTFKDGANDNTTSYIVDTVTENGYTYNYSYDALGNITAYTKTNNNNNQVVESYIYRYDNKGQLIYAGTTDTNGMEYTYDANGNILTKKNLSTNATVSYGYNDPTWADLLTSYNGQTITYDAIGNPLSYNNGSAMTFTWVNGRNLETVTKNGNTFYYSYDEDGNRTSKSVGDAYTQYMIFDGIMYGERTYDSNGETVIYYLYDENDSKYGFTYNGTYYYYQFNLQGDVTGIYDANGQLVVQYAYDAWGKLLSVTGSLASTIGQINPIRYRGYYYDNETGFYLTGTRYYDPEIGRFINADGYVSTGQDVTGYNMFAYCGNNPVNRADPTGTFWKEVGNFFKNVGTAIYNGAKKVVKATVGSFQIEGGVGYGLGASAKVGPVKASASAYQDGLTVGLKNGSTYTAIKGGAGISAQITKKASVGLSTEYEHRFETDLVRDWDEHTTMSAPWAVYNCPKTVKDPLQFSFPIVKPIEGNLSQGLFIGISAEAHIGVGGHFTIGWDATEFWRILTE